MPKRVGARTQPCFTPFLMSNGSDILHSYWMVAFTSSWKDLIMLCSLGGKPIFRRMLKSPSPLTRSNAFFALCTSPPVDGERISCPLWNVLLGSHIGTLGRRVRLAVGDAGARRGQRVCLRRAGGNCPCSYCSRFCHPCSCTGLQSWHHACLVVRPLHSNTDKGHHAVAAGGCFCSA